MGRPTASPWPPASSLGNPYHPWSSLYRMVAAIAVFAAVGIMMHGVATAAEQRRTRKLVR